MDDLRETMENLVENLFGKIEKKWVDAYFPFTDPSLELEIYFKGLNLLDSHCFEL